MTELFGLTISRYGQEMICHSRGGEETGRGMAVVQPITEADWQHAAGALGAYRTDRFLCLAEPGLPLGGGFVTWGGQDYEVMTVRPVWMKGKVTHLWMVLRLAEERGL
jgi:hypothetical protein